jgi:hypothetical protein
MRKNVRLPIFENAPRFAPKTTFAVQTDWLTPKEPLSLPNEPFSPAPRGIERVRKFRKRSWLEILTFGLLGRAKATSELVQAEMNLDNVRVIRNDLADSDLEVVVNKKKKFTLRKTAAAPPETAATPQPQPAAKPAKHVPPKRLEWNELAARLFQIGQH